MHDKQSILNCKCDPFLFLYNSFQMKAEAQQSHIVRSLHWNLTSTTIWKLIVFEQNFTFCNAYVNVNDMLLNWEKSIPGLYFMLMLMLGFYEASSNQSIPCIAASLDYAQTKTHNLQFFKIMERFQCKRGKNYFTANSHH